MTYNEITKTLDRVDASIVLTKEQISKEADAKIRRQLEYTVDYLCGFKNYIKYVKEFDERQDSKTEVKVTI